MVEISIDDNLCAKCGTCVVACPYGVFAQQDKLCVPEARLDVHCISCGHCVAICPAGAIAHPDFHEGRVKPIDRSLRPAPEQVMCLMQSRRSIRAFTDKPVEKALLERVVDGARTGPSPGNAQRVGYVVVQERAAMNKVVALLAENYGKVVFLLKNPAMLDSLPAPTREKFASVKPMLPVMERIVGRIKAGDDILQRGSPSLLVFHAPRAPNDPFGPKIDVTIAIQNASLMCSSLGLGSCELGYLEMIADREPQLQKLLGIPDDHAIYGMLAVGHPKYVFKNWIEKPMAKVSWILPGDKDALARLEKEEHRKNVEYWDNFSRNYDDDIDYAYGPRMRPLGIERLKNEGRLGKAVEMACGTGYYSKTISEMSDSVLVTDLSEKFLDIAKERLKGLQNVSFGIADCEQTGIPDNEFDTVFTGLLGNSIDLGKAYPEFYRILKPGGSYITYIAMFEMMDPEPKRLLRQRQISRGKTGAPPKYFEHSLDDYRTSAENAGFKVVVQEVVRDPEDAASVPLLYMKCVKP